MRKWIPVCLLAVLCLMMPLLGSATLAASMPDGGFCGPAADWTFDAQTGTLAISGEGAVRQSPWYSFVDETHLLIRHVVVEEGITELESMTFADCTNLETVELPQTLQIIGSSVFKNCRSLKSVILPENVRSLGRESFASCYNLEQITFGSSLEYVGICCFFGCNQLKNLGFPDTLLRIDKQAFLCCDNLKTVSFGAGTQYIGEDAFSSCGGIQSFSVNPENPYFRAVDGVLFTADSARLVMYPQGRAGEYTVPDGVTRIGDNAFYACNGLTAVTIPGSVLEIGTNAFRGCGALIWVTMEEGLQTIGWGAFSCENLRQITIPASVTRVEDQALDGTALEQIIFLGDKPFLGRDLWHVNATAFYPAGNTSWAGTNEQLDGVIVWKEACSGQHTVVVSPAVSADCLHAGLTEGASCEACGMIMKFQDVTDLTDHTFGPWKTVCDPSYDTTGWEERHCSVCGKTESNILPMLEPVPEEKDDSGSWGMVILVAVGGLIGGFIGWRTYTEEKGRKKA